MALDDAKIAILGAGPIGLEAAARAIREGFDVVVFERGDVGAHVSQWGHIRLFTPFGLCVGPEGKRMVREIGATLPRESVFVTGAEYRERYLLALGAAIAVRGALETDATVVTVGRERWLKSEAIGKPERKDGGFRILWERDGQESITGADVVLDCTGTFGHPGWMGPAGAPALGERRVSSALTRWIPDILGRDRNLYKGKKTLLVGAGQSAATSALLLAELVTGETGTSFQWYTRGSHDPPIVPIPNDPLPERAKLTDQANAIAADPPKNCVWRNGVDILEVASGGSGQPFRVSARRNGEVGSDTFDRIVANVGFEPDDSLYRQLQIHECYATRGPMKMSAAILAASGDGPADCLTLGGFGPEALVNPEPNYFILGMKSYGTNSAFLMKTGFEQVRDVFGILNTEY